MSGNEFDFNIDSILEEFSDFSSHIGEQEKPRPEPPAGNPAPVQRPAAPVFPTEPTQKYTPSQPERRAEPVISQRPTQSFTPPQSPARPKAQPESAPRRGEARESAPAERQRRSEPVRSEAKGSSRPAKEKAEAKPRRVREENPLKPQTGEKAPGVSPLTPFIGIICALIILLGLVWTGLNVHPGTSAATVDAASQRLDMVSQLDVYLNNMASDAMGDLAYIRKVYKIDENATFAPAPDQSLYGTVQINEADKVLEVIQRARDSGLLEGQDVVFDPNANFYHLSEIQYYCDDTILVICWKEQIDGRVCSIVEVKIADASQFRRKITEDTYGSSVKQYASQLSASANAVVAMNADFYAFRSLGMVVYQRQLYRFNTANASGFKSYNCIDHCFIDGKGDMNIMYRGEEFTKESMEQYIADNDILFGLAFGPVLVDNSQVVPCNSYPAGEIHSEYSRAGLGQLDSLHYLYMTVNWSSENTPRANIAEFADIFQRKGVKTAYCLDGGQTSEIVMNDVPFNYIDFNAERTVSDIIYFATAIPESEVRK